MFEVSCFDSNGDSIEIHQWDLNQTVTIQMHGCDASYLQYQPEVHFANINSKEAIRVPARVVEGTNDTIVADIPNILLTEHYPLFVYIYLFTNTDYTGDDAEKHYSQATLLRTEIPVLRRVRPCDYNYTQNIERMTAQQIADRASEGAKKAVEDALSEAMEDDGAIGKAINEALDNVNQQVAKAEAAAESASSAAEDAIADLKAYGDDKYVNEEDIVYDLDDYTAADNDGKVLSASEALDIIQMIEEKTDYFGLCGTDAGTQVKLVEVAADNLALKKGTILHVRFAHENTTSKPKLSINGQNSVPIQASGIEGAYWKAHQMVTFVYDDQLDMGANVEPVWQCVSAPVYTNGDIIGNQAEKHIVLTDSDVNDQMRFNYGSNTKMYLDSLGLHIGQDNKLYDEFGKLVAGNVAPALTSDDPNTTNQHLILTNNANVPMKDSSGNTYYMYVITFFEGKYDGDTKKSQIAIPYNRIGSAYHRYYANSQWSTWRRHVNEDEISKLIESQDDIVNWKHPMQMVVNQVQDDKGRNCFFRLVHEDGFWYFRPCFENESFGGYTGVNAKGKVLIGSIGIPIHKVYSDEYHCKQDTVKNDKSTGNLNAVSLYSTGVIRSRRFVAKVDDKTTDQIYTDLKFEDQVLNVRKAICPIANGAGSVGQSDLKWKNIYASTSTITTSDINKKEDLALIDDKYIELFDLVQPYSYKFIDGTSGRTHTGFISQHVEEAMEQVGLAPEDLAFFCKDIDVEHIYDDEGCVIETKQKLDENGDPVYTYSLRYEEYVAIMTEKIKRMEKKHNEEIAELRATIAEIQSKLS